MAKPKRVFYKVAPIGSIKDLIAQAVVEGPDIIAYKYRKPDGSILEVTYKEFSDQTVWLGTGLYSLGVADRHVGCTGENSYNWICSYFTILKSSGVFCSLDKDLPDDDMANIVNDGDDEAIFCDAKREKLFMRIRDKIPNVKYFICFDRDEDEGEFLSFNKLMAKGKELYEAGERGYTKMSSDPNDLKMLVYTSGTTGLAKGVMLTEKNMLSVPYWSMVTSTLRYKDVGLSVLPYHHCYESVAGLLPAIHFNMTLCINESLKRVLKNMTFYKPSYMYLVPAFVEVIYRRIWANIDEKGKRKTVERGIKLSRTLLKSGIDVRRKLFADIHEALGGRLEKIVCGGAPLRPEIGQFFEDIGITLCNGYGITECSPLVSVNADNDCDPATVGHVLPCTEVKIDNPNEDGEGEVLVKGDVVMKGYYKNPEATKEVFTEDGWFKTGDYGKLDELDRLLITGRKKNIIILGNGKNIYPEELESYIGRVPYVLESIVYGARDEQGVEVALCAEVLVDPAVMKNTDREQLKSKLKTDIMNSLSSLPAYKQITKIVVRETPFVKTTSNKIRRDKDGKPL